MEVSHFAELYRLRVRRDDSGDSILPGKHGHLYPADDGRFGLCLLDCAPNQPSQTKTLLSRRRKALAAGFTPHQFGDCESILLFDPEDKTQASLAIRLVGAKQKRVLTAETKAVLAQRMKRIRSERMIDAEAR